MQGVKVSDKPICLIAAIVEHQWVLAASDEHPRSLTPTRHFVVCSSCYNACLMLVQSSLGRNDEQR